MKQYIAILLLFALTSCSRQVVEPMQEQPKMVDHTPRLGQTIDGRIDAGIEIRFLELLGVFECSMTFNKSRVSEEQVLQGLQQFIDSRMEKINNSRMPLYPIPDVKKSLKKI